MLLSNPEGGDSVVPLIVRLPIVVALVAVRRPWALAAGAALLTPAFHFHSFVLLLPAAVLFVESLRDRARTGDEETFRPLGESNLDARQRAA